MNIITNYVKENGVAKIIMEYKEPSNKHKMMLVELKETIKQRTVIYVYNIDDFGDGSYEEWFCAKYLDNSKNSISITKCMDLEHNAMRTYDWYLHLRD